MSSDSKLTPLETELLKSVNALETSMSAFESRLTRLEKSMQSDAATAQSQRKAIDDKLKAFSDRILSLEQSLTSFSGLPASLAICGKHLNDLAELTNKHAVTYNNAAYAWKGLLAKWVEKEKEYEGLKFQVTQLTTALRSLVA